MRTVETTIPHGTETKHYANPTDVHPFLVERHVVDAEGERHVVEVYAGGKLVTTACASRAVGA